MGLGLIYWICWVIALIAGATLTYLEGLLATWVVFAVWMIMNFLLGWKVFGLPISGSTE